MLVLSIARAEHASLSAAIRAELERSRHDVELRCAAPGAAGKFENLNRLLSAGENNAAAGFPLSAEQIGPGDSAARGGLAEYDWLLVVDDDVVLPRGFLDRLLFLAERFGSTSSSPLTARARTRRGA